MRDEPSSDEPMERTVSQYIASAAGEGAMSVARRLSEALGIGLDEVLAAVQSLGEWGPAATLAGAGTLTVGGPTVGVTVTVHGGAVLVADGDVGAATETLNVVRQVDVNELNAQASGRGLARLSANQRILIAVVMIAAIFPVLPPEVRQALQDESGLAAALAAVLVLLKR